MSLKVLSITPLTSANEIKHLTEDVREKIGLQEHWCDKDHDSCRVDIQLNDKKFAIYYGYPGDGIAWAMLLDGKMVAKGSEHSEFEIIGKDEDVKLAGAWFAYKQDEISSEVFDQKQSPKSNILPTFINCLNSAPPVVVSDRFKEYSTPTGISFTPTWEPYFIWEPY